MAKYVDRALKTKVFIKKSILFFRYCMSVSSNNLITFYFDVLGLKYRKTMYESCKIDTILLVIFNEHLAGI